MKSPLSSVGQRQRILDRLLQGDEVPAVELHRIGSGKENGYCGSFSKRISEIRTGLGAYGCDVKCREEWHGGQRRTFYQIVPDFNVATKPPQ